ncbi:MAG: cytochrome c oxidase assembly factor Coa1 family protein [Terriglobales bacterium]
MKCPACSFDIPEGSSVCPSCGTLAAAAPPTDWWPRHWKKTIALGCMGFLLLCVLGVAAMVFLIFGSIRSSDVAQQALARARAHPTIIQKLGTSIEPGWMISGSINTSPGRGEAKLTIPISGPRGSATIYADAEKRGGDWEFSVLEVAIDGEPGKVDLLASPHGIMEQ